MTKEKPVWIIGHRNPDTDSVCSAIAYAYLKRQTGLYAEPARAGKLNPETRYILDRFGFAEPRLINYFYPTLEDIDLYQAPTVTPDETLHEVGRLFVENPRLKSVPVLGDDGSVVGIITVGDLAKRYYQDDSIKELENGETGFDQIIRTLEGTLVTGDATGRFYGKVKIGASEAETLASDVEPGDLVILGDREDVQLRLLSLGRICLVLTRNTPVSDAVRQAAEANGSLIITTPYNTYTTARMINQSISVRFLMTKDVVTFNTTDLLQDVKDKIVRAKYVSYPVLYKGKYCGVIDRGMMLEPQRQRVILVDHNERSQAAEGIEETHILEILDHHRLGGLTTGAPIYIRQEPVGSCATIVANMFTNLNVPIPQNIAAILYCAIVSDTLYFRSPTTTAVDRATADRLAAAAGIGDPEALAMEVLRAGSVLNRLSPAALIRNDVKEFDFGGLRVTVSQINIMDRGQARARLPQLQQALDEFRAKEGYGLCLFMLTDVLGESTDLLESGSKDSLLDRVFGERQPGGYYFLPGVLSRKKQIIPPLTEAIKQENN
jgi:manganese-dependent inorganic pyrophosphatase